MKIIFLVSIFLLTSISAYSQLDSTVPYIRKHSYIQNFFDSVQSQWKRIYEVGENAKYIFIQSKNGIDTFKVVKWHVGKNPMNPYYYSAKNKKGKLFVRFHDGDNTYLLLNGKTYKTTIDINTIE